MDMTRRNMMLAGAAAVGGLLPAQAAEGAQEPGLFETIASRTAIRKFDPKRPVSDEQVEKLLRAAMCAPTALNTQPWEFVVVRDPAKIKALGEAMPATRCGNDAQVVIVVCGSLESEITKKFWSIDCSLASENLLLAAKALGLGAVFTAGWPAEDRVVHLRRILGIPPTHLPLNVIPIGYPAENPPPKNKWKPERIHKDQW